MGPRGAGRRLNDQERMEILDILARESKVKNVDLAKRYGVSEGAIRKLKQIKDTIRDRYYMGNEHNRDKRKRGGFMRNAPFEQELYEWICRMRERQAYQLIPLTQTAVRQQAILLAKNYERMGNFKASPGWFARFCSRHRLDPPMTSSAAAAPSAAALSAAAAAAAAAAAPAEASGSAPATAATDESTAALTADANAAVAAAAVASMESKPLAVSAATDDQVFLIQPLDALTSASVPTSTASTVGVAVQAVNVETKAEPAVTPEPSKDTTALDEQAKLAAREHNEAVLSASRAAREAAKADCDVVALEKSLYGPTADEIKAAAPAEPQHKEKEAPATAEPAPAPATNAVGAVAPSEDEIFSLGL